MMNFFRSKPKPPQEVPSDVFIEKLAGHFKNKADKIIADNEVLALVADWLQLLTKKFPPSDKEDFTPADSSMHPSVAFLFEFFQQVRLLRISPSPHKLHGTISLSVFKSLTTLYLHRVEVEGLTGFQQLRFKLEAFHVQKCLGALMNPLFKDCGGDMVSKELPWASLSILDLHDNLLLSLTCLHLFPKVHTFNFARNRLEFIPKEICSLSTASVLNLSFNHIAELKPFLSEQAFNSFINLRVLDLSNNKIASLYGLECVTHIRELYLGCNAICHMDELRRIRHILSLQILQLNGNPVSFELAYRVRVFSSLPEVWTDLVLDGLPADQDESLAAQDIINSERCSTVSYARSMVLTSSDDNKSIASTRERSGSWVLREQQRLKQTSSDQLETTMNSQLNSSTTANSDPRPVDIRDSVNEVFSPASLSSMTSRRKSKVALITKEDDNGEFDEMSLNDGERGPIPRKPSLKTKKSLHESSSSLPNDAEIRGKTFDEVSLSSDKKRPKKKKPKTNSNPRGHDSADDTPLLSTSELTFSRRSSTASLKQLTPEEVNQMIQLGGLALYNAYLEQQNPRKEASRALSPQVEQMIDETSRPIESDVQSIGSHQVKQASLSQPLIGSDMQINGSNSHNTINTDNESPKTNALSTSYHQNMLKYIQVQAAEDFRHGGNPTKSSPPSSQPPPRDDPLHPSDLLHQRKTPLSSASTSPTRPGSRHRRSRSTDMQQNQQQPSLPKFSTDDVIVDDAEGRFAVLPSPYRHDILMTSTPMRPNNALNQSSYSLNSTLSPLPGSPCSNDAKDIETKGPSDSGNPGLFSSPRRFIAGSMDVNNQSETSTLVASLYETAVHMPSPSLSPDASFMMAKNTPESPPTPAELKMKSETRQKSPVRSNSSVFIDLDKSNGSISMLNAFHSENNSRNLNNNNHNISLSSNGGGDASRHSIEGDLASEDILSSSLVESPPSDDLVRELQSIDSPDVVIVPPTPLDALPEAELTHVFFVDVWDRTNQLHNRMLHLVGTSWIQELELDGKLLATYDLSVLSEAARCDNLDRVVRLTFSYKSWEKKAIKCTMESAEQVTQLLDIVSPIITSNVLNNSVLRTSERARCLKCDVTFDVDDARFLRKEERSCPMCGSQQVVDMLVTSNAIDSVPTSPTTSRKQATQSVRVPTTTQSVRVPTATRSSSDHLNASFGPSLRGMQNSDTVSVHSREFAPFGMGDVDEDSVSIRSLHVGSSSHGLGHGFKTFDCLSLRSYSSTPEPHHLGGKGAKHPHLSTPSIPISKNNGSANMSRNTSSYHTPLTSPYTSAPESPVHLASSHNGSLSNSRHLGIHGTSTNRQVVLKEEVEIPTTLAPVCCEDIDHHVELLLRMSPELSEHEKITALVVCPLLHLEAALQRNAAPVDHVALIMPMRFVLFTVVEANTFKFYYSQSWADLLSLQIGLGQQTLRLKFRTNHFELLIGCAATCIDLVRCIAHTFSSPALVLTDGRSLGALSSVVPSLPLALDPAIFNSSLSAFSNATALIPKINSELKMDCFSLVSLTDEKGGLLEGQVVVMVVCPLVHLLLKEHEWADVEPHMAPSFVELQKFTIMELCGLGYSPAQPRSLSLAWDPSSSGPKQRAIPQKYNSLKNAISSNKWRVVFGSDRELARCVVCLNSFWKEEFFIDLPVEEL